MRPTMADVAEKVGVSISTVSLVLNEKPGISPELRLQVLKAVEEVGYRLPERAPARLASDPKSITVVHYASPQHEQGIDLSGLFIDFVASIRDYYQDKNINWTLIANYVDGDRNHLGYHLLEVDQLPSDGFIFMGIPHRQSSLLDRVLAEEKPAVVLSRDWPEIPISTVSQDHARHARIALEYLKQLGHRKIAFIAREVDREFDWFAPRLTVYRDTMTGLDAWDESLVAVAKDAGEATKAVLENHPDVTAFFAVHDENAMLVMRTLQAMGYQIPEDFSVIGLDNSVHTPDHLPLLTTVAFPHEEVARLAAELLIKQNHNPELSYGKLFVQSRLIERGSCARPKNIDNKEPHTNGNAHKGQRR